MTAAGTSTTTRTIKRFTWIYLQKIKNIGLSRSIATGTAHGAKMNSNCGIMIKTTTKKIIQTTPKKNLAFLTTSRVATQMPTISDGSDAKAKERASAATLKAEKVDSQKAIVVHSDGAKVLTAKIDEVVITVAKDISRAKVKARAKREKALACDTDMARKAMRHHRWIYTRALPVCPLHREARTPVVKSVAVVGTVQRIAQSTSNHKDLAVLAWSACLAAL